jgi:hypothetical protein
MTPLSIFVRFCIWVLGQARGSGSGHENECSVTFLVESDMDFTCNKGINKFMVYILYM